MQKRETAADRRARFRKWCADLGATFRIYTVANIYGDHAVSKATVEVIDPNDGIMYASTGHKMVYFKEEVSGIKDTTAFSAAETMAISRAMGFLLDGEEEVTTEEDWNQVIVYTLSNVSAKFGISELEARKYIETLNDDQLKSLSLEHLGKLSSKAALAQASAEVL